MPTRRPLHPHRPWLASLLVLALLLAQTVGLAHRIAHADGPPARGAHGHELHEPRAAADFDDHHDAGDCRLYDQLHLADALGSTPPVIGWLPAAAGAPAASDIRTAQAAVCGYHARGPPPQA
ncbi:MAG: hypothetical protein J0M00_05635 [Burkholderiales bacterium]|nr:hypothetical protein [Burkholderiales bacterium]